MNEDSKKPGISRVELEAILFEQEHRIFRLLNNYFRVRSSFDPNDPRYKVISTAFWMRLLWQFLFRSAVPILASGAAIAGLIGLYFSYQANSISRNANRIANEAIANADEANQIASEANSISSKLVQFEQLNPTFVVKLLTGRQLDGVFNPDIYKEDGEAIVVENKGNTIRSADSDAVVFLSVRITELHRAPKTVLLPLLSVYFVHSKSDDNKKLFLIAPHLWKKMHALQKELSKLATARKTFVEIDLERYVNISFADREGEFRSEYYRIVPVRGAVLLEEHHGKEVFETHRKANKEIKRLLDFDRMTSEEVWGNVKDHLTAEN